MTNLNLIETYLHKQNALTAVDVFSKTHEEGAFPKHEKFYRDLIPKRESVGGEQLAYQVDLDTCTGCKACVAGCHSMNGLDKDEAWRKTGTIQSTDEKAPFSQTLTSACHHCLEPACALGCPTMAYEKDPLTGIVKHLDDQCFGCRYCELKCPYGVPQYNENLGIVRKCDMCTERLSEGEAPACVQSCPNGAISITIVKKDELLKTASESFAKIPNTPDVNITLPTTQYISKRDFKNASNNKESHLKAKAEHPHTPLVFMLVLTQFSVGGIVSATAMSMMSLHCSELILSALILASIGLGIAPLHLGKPHLAYKAFLGFRTSWLSREMIAFAPYPLFITLALIPAYSEIIQHYTPIALPEFIFTSSFKTITLLAASIIGIISVFCSAMIYIDTKRKFWETKRTLAFFTFTVLSSAFLLAFLQEVYLGRTEYSILSLVGFFLCCLIKLATDTRFKHKQHQHELLTSAKKLIEGDQSFNLSNRICIGVISGLILPLFFMTQCFSSEIVINPYLSAIMAIGWLVSEFYERVLFFTLALPQKMPGQNN